MLRQSRMNTNAPLKSEEPKEKAPGTPKESKSININYGYDWKHAVGLAAGTYGTVFKVQRKNLSTGRTRVVAVKAVKKKDERRSKPDLRETVALSFMQKHPHENIVTFFGNFESKNDYIFQGEPYTCFVFEYIEGDLDDMITGMGLEDLWPVRCIAYITIQLLNGLGFLHENHFVHCDMKPDNILIDKEFKIKLTDFGFTTKLPDNKIIIDTDGWSGTSHYISPEEWECKLGYSSDIWAAGVIIFKLCSRGGLPWETPVIANSLGSKEKAALEDNLLSNRIRTTEPNWDSSTWKKHFPEVKKFLKRLLRKNYLTRPTAKTALQDPWLKAYFAKSLEYLSSKNFQNHFKVKRTDIQV